VSPQARLVGVVERVCAATSAIRARTVDDNRNTMNGGPASQLHDRLEAVIQRLEHVAAELEETLA
jgi:hypothetical protein